MNMAFAAISGYAGISESQSRVIRQDRRGKIVFDSNRPNTFTTPKSKLAG